MGNLMKVTRCSDQDLYFEILVPGKVSNIRKETVHEWAVSFFLIEDLPEAGKAVL